MEIPSKSPLLTWVMLKLVSLILNSKPFHLNSIALLYYYCNIIKKKLSSSSASQFLDGSSCSSCSSCSLFQSNHKHCKQQPLCLTLHAFLCKPCFLPKTAGKLRARCAETFICAEHMIYTYVITKNMQLRASACIPLYVQHFQVQGEREQTIVTTIK